MSSWVRRALVAVVLCGPLLALGPLDASPSGAGARTAGASCHGLANRIALAPGTDQLLTVLVADHRATTAWAQAWSRGADGCLVARGPTIPAEVGWAGTSAAKHEGDGTTPIGTFRLGARTYDLGSPLPGAERHQALTCGSWWDEDPSSPAYNRFVQLPCGQPPSFGGGSEALWTEQVAYQHFVEIRYNAGPIVAGRGSGIFLHDGTGGPTAGCVSLPPGTLELVLSWLDPALRPAIAIGTRADLAGA